MEKRMVLYHFKQVTLAGDILNTVDAMLEDDKAAIKEAVRLDHAPFVEIWCGSRMVTRIAPGGLLY